MIWDAKVESGTQVARSILVVDDDSAVLKLFGKILQRGGFSVRLTASSQEAGMMLREAPFDLLVLALSMPEAENFDGFDLLKELRVSMPGLPIVVVSGYLQGTLLKAAELLGAKASLSKTEAPTMLLQTVRAILRS